MVEWKESKRNGYGLISSTTTAVTWTNCWESQETSVQDSLVRLVYLPNISHMCYWLNNRKNDYVWVRHITKNGIFILTHNTVWWKTLSTISWPLSGRLQVNSFLSNTHIFGSTFKLWVYHVLLFLFFDKFFKMIACLIVIVINWIFLIQGWQRR
jgi:hypothetical protein